MEGEGFEPPNPKERIYSPPRLARLRYPSVNHSTILEYIILNKKSRLFSKFFQFLFQIQNLRILIPLRHKIIGLPFIDTLESIAHCLVIIGGLTKHPRLRMDVQMTK